MKITRLDHAGVRNINARVNEVLKKLGDEMGIDFEPATCRFDAEQTKISVIGRVPSPTGETPEQAAWKANAAGYGLNPADLGTRFAIAGQTFTVEGFQISNRTGRQKNDWISIKRVTDGKPMRVRVSQYKLAKGIGPVSAPWMPKPPPPPAAPTRHNAWR